MTGNTLGGVMRQFIRHPVSIPIEVRAGERAGGGLHHTLNLSLGGLEIDSDSEIEPGTIVEVCIPFVEPAFETCGRVAWCRCRGTIFELGVQFLDADDAYRTRIGRRTRSAPGSARTAWRRRWPSRR